MAVPSPALAAALDHHRQGALDTAQQAYDQIIASPHTSATDAASAQHWLGVLHLQRQDARQALMCFEGALTRVPTNFASQLNLGHARLQLGDSAGAIGAYETASQAPEPDIAAAAFAAMAREQMRRAIAAMASEHTRYPHLSAALNALDRAVELQPNVASFHDSRGSVFNVLGEYGKAEQAHKAALALQPNHPGFHNNVGLAVKAQGRVDDAIWHFRDALRRDPAYVPALINLGQAVAMTGEFDQASAPLTRAIAIAPDNATAHQELGNVFAAMADYDNALTHYKRAVTLAPDAALAWQNLGAMHFESAALRDAGDAFKQALALNPALSLARFSLASIQLAEGEWRPGWANYEARQQVWQAHPDDLQASPPGLRWLGTHAPRQDQDRGCLIVAGNINPSNTNKDASHTEHRAEHRAKNQAQIQAEGEADVTQQGYFSLRDKRILLYAEQGLGDTIQFFRFCGPVAAQAKQVILAVPASLCPLLAPMAATLANNIIVLPLSRDGTRAYADRHIDCHCPLLSLPLALGLDRPDALVLRAANPASSNDGPAIPPYIAAPLVKRAPPQWTSPLPRRGAKTRLLAGRAVTRIARLTKAQPVPPVLHKVGLAWSGKSAGLSDLASVRTPATTPLDAATDDHRAKHPYDKRAIPLDVLEPLFDLPNIEWHVLQTEISDADRDTLTALMAIYPIVLHSQKFADFADTANAMGELDHVVSVDTSVAHLAGAMGWPVSLMLPLAADWRWADRAGEQGVALAHPREAGAQVPRGACYWYPSIQMFKQAHRNDWAPVVNAVKQSLTARFNVGKKR